MSTRRTSNVERLTPNVELERLLSESVQAVRRREQTAFDQAAAPFASSIVIYGAGGVGRKTLAGLRVIRNREVRSMDHELRNPDFSIPYSDLRFSGSGVPTPVAFADSNQELWNTSVDSLPVLAPEAAARQFGNHAAFVVAVWSPGAQRRFSYIKTQLTALGCSRVVSFILLFWKYADIFLPYRRIDAPHKIAARADDIRRAFALLDDDESRQGFLIQLARLQSWADYDPPAAAVNENHYFPADIFSLRPDETFVDCGAFDGDTIRELIRHAGGETGDYANWAPEPESSESVRSAVEFRAGRPRRPPFSNVIAFEPDPANYEKLRRYVATLPVELARRVELHKLGVGARAERVRFDADGTVDSAVSPAGSLETDIVTLDTILGPTVPTFIKMDIEGAEPMALVGGRQVISRHAPVLAICVYHQQDHLWRIPLLIHSFSEQYHLFLRRFGDEFADVVCFAVPEARLTR